MKNYIGITGCTTVEEAKGLLALFEKHGFTMEAADHVPMVGILVSPRNRDADWCSARYPPLHAIPELIDILADRVFLTLHIDEKAASDWVNDVLWLLANIPNAKKVNGIQCNVMHPNVEDMKRLLATTRRALILQYSQDFLLQTPARAIDEFLPYSESCEFALIDPSRGRGIELNLSAAVSHYNYLKSVVQVGFAGGFNPKNIVQYLGMIMRETGGINFSTDVESGVRTDDVLDLGKVDEYLGNTKGAFVTFLVS